MDVVDQFEGDGWRIVPSLHLLSDSVDIDHLVPEAPWFWQALASQCVPDCCGLDAYDFSAESVAWACGSSAIKPEGPLAWRSDTPGDVEKIASDLRTAAQALRGLQAEAVSADLFNHILTPEAYANLFDDVASKIPT